MCAVLLTTSELANAESLAANLGASSTTGLITSEGCSGHGHLRFFDQRGELQPEFSKNLEAGIWSFEYSPNGHKLAIGCEDKLARILDARTGKIDLQLQHGGGVPSVSWCRDNKRLATACYDSIARIWDLGTGQESLRLHHEGAVWSVAWWAFGPRLATGSSDNFARIWDVSTGEEIVRLAHRRSSPHSAAAEAGGVASVAWSPDGKQLATSCYDGLARVYDADTGVALFKFASGCFATSIAWRPDGRVLASSNGVGLVKLYDTTSGMEIAQLPQHHGTINHIAWRPDGLKIATASDDTFARVFDAETTEEELKIEHSDWVMAVGWHA